MDILRTIIKQTKHLIDVVCIALLKILHISPSKMHYCNICGRNTLFVRGAGKKAKVLKEYAVIGGGRRKHIVCPYCNSIDRSRWLYYTLEHYVLKNKLNTKILHFAPEKCVEGILRNRFAEGYISGDLEKGRADFIIDITNIHYKDCEFDISIASHVLEHIVDEGKAISELMRVTKPDGVIVLAFPIATGLECTYEDEKIHSVEDRKKKFGQKDHVRLYGMDYKRRLEKYGLEIQEFVPKMILEAELIRRMSLIPEDVIIICTRARRDRL